MGVEMLYGRLPTTRSLPEPPAGASRREIDREHVGLDDLESRRHAQPRREIAVELDHRQRRHALEQREGQRAPARPDLDQRLAGARIDAVDDPMDHRPVDEEMLAEPLLGAMQGSAAARDSVRYCACGGSRSSM